MKKLMINGLSVIDICKNYLNDVKSVTDRVKAIFDVSNFWEIRKQYFPQFHIKKGDVELVFHGRGVRILEHEHELCDIEYGMDIHICKLEEHRIFEYIKKDNPLIAVQLSELQQEFQKLLTVGQFKKISGLYFINNHENKETLKKYKHNNT